MITNISEVVDILRCGGLVAMATDTLFALSCDATNQSAVDKLYLVKKRDNEKKLPVFFHSLEHVMEYCELPQIAITLVKKFWPGKLTVILQSRDNFNLLTTNIAVRVPGSHQILEIIRKLNRPIIGTSANISGCNNLNKIEEVVAAFASSDVLIFRGNTTNISGVQSTIVSFQNDNIHLIREGAISLDEIFSSLSENIS